MLWEKSHFSQWWQLSASDPVINTKWLIKTTNQPSCQADGLKYRTVFIIQHRPDSVSELHLPVRSSPLRGPTRYKSNVNECFMDYLRVSVSYRWQHSPWQSRAYSKWLLRNPGLVRLQSDCFPIETISYASRGSCPLDVMLTWGWPLRGVDIWIEGWVEGSKTFPVPVAHPPPPPPPHSVKSKNTFSANSLRFFSSRERCIWMGLRLH